MKTLTRSTALFLSALLLSLNVFATGLEFEQEEYIDDIPFNVEDVINQVTMEEALAVEFSLSDEEYINDIPLYILSQESSIKYSETISQDFSFQEEAYIDDIPESIVMDSVYGNVAVVN